MATVHVIGAGMAGISCAVELVKARQRVVLWEAAAQAGGRCRSFHDATLDRTIDNGNHLILGANPAVFAYLETIGAARRPGGPGAGGLPLRRPADGRALDRAPQCRPGAVVDHGAHAPGAGQPRAPLPGRPRTRPRTRWRHRGGATQGLRPAAGEALGTAHRGRPQRLGGGGVGAPAVAGGAPHLRPGRGGLPRLSHPRRARTQSGGAGGALCEAGRRPAPLQPPAPRHPPRRARRDRPRCRGRRQRR